MGGRLLRGRLLNCRLLRGRLLCRRFRRGRDLGAGLPPVGVLVGVGVGSGPLRPQPASSMTPARTVTNKIGPLLR
ncbi:MAG: hypothetical protein R3A10_13465 [Caldilineaceae bacterium]